MSIDQVRRKAWMENQTSLRPLLEKGKDPLRGLHLCLRQHAQTHASLLAPKEEWSFQDQALKGITDDIFRRIPHNMEHSPAWCLYHISRIEDMTMNVLVADSEMMLDEGGWNKKMGIPYRDSANAMGPEIIRELSESIDLEQLLAYRLAVGIRTRIIINEIDPGQLKEKVRVSRLEKLLENGDVQEEAYGLIDYWGNRTIAGLLLMPATRHNFVHLNEIVKLRKRKS